MPNLRNTTMMNILLFFLVILLSCDSTNKVPIVIINDNKSEIPFLELFAKKYETNFEETKNSIIGYIRNIIPGNNKYLFIIEANGSEPIKVFDFNGKYINNLGVLGEGPGEYRYPIAIQSDSHFIYLLDNQLRRINIYRSKDFSFVKSFKLTYFYTSMLLYNYKLILKRQNWSENDIGIGLFDVYSTGGGKEDSFKLGAEIPKKINIRNIPELNFGCILFREHKIVYIDMIEYKLYCYDFLKETVDWIKQLDVKRNNNINGMMEEKINADNVIFGLAQLNNNTILLKMGSSFYLFDEYGNFKSKINIPFVFMSLFYNGLLITSSQPYEESNKKVMNPKLIIYEVK